MKNTQCKPLPAANFHRLRFLSVIGGFLDGQTFEFSNGLNCLIGARGTGKTTALELIRYALDMPPSRDVDATEMRRIESLVQKNLGGGRIQVGIETKDGLFYIVSRSWGEDPIVLNADGTRMKYGVVAQKLANAFWPAELSKAITGKNVQSLVSKAELNQDQADKVIATLSGSETLYQLETVELIDEPRIQLRDGEYYKDSLALSTGQKCTAILPILLMDSENPLLVDQPEDNLDNRFIFETIVSSIRRIKHHRQLIFVTHNPNIPVLADAEQVFVLDSDGSVARKANAGSVDHCKTDIITLLEGGEEAFKQRRERYAY